MGNLLFFRHATTRALVTPASVYRTSHLQPSLQIQPEMPSQARKVGVKYFTILLGRGLVSFLGEEVDAGWPDNIARRRSTRSPFVSFASASQSMSN